MSQEQDEGEGEGGISFTSFSKRAKKKERVRFHFFFRGFISPWAEICARESLSFSHSSHSFDRREWVLSRRKRGEKNESVGFYFLHFSRLLTFIIRLSTRARIKTRPQHPMSCEFELSLVGRLRRLWWKERPRKGLLTFYSLFSFEFLRTIKLHNTHLSHVARPVYVLLALFLVCDLLWDLVGWGQGWRGGTFWINNFFNFCNFTHKLLTELPDLNSTKNYKKSIIARSIVNPVPLV